METCSQKLRDGDACDGSPAYRFTWPGNDEAYICEPHAKKLKSITDAMGFHCQLIPLAPAPSD